ncbi:TDP-N-acetylfucosamine:lipid II N-acetylfucosaminyltransferase [soil metagenome]
MNYHIMVDDKFIDSFIEDVEKVSDKSDNRYLIRNDKKFANYVTHSKTEWFDSIFSTAFIQIIKSIKITDKVFVHWYDYEIGKLLIDLELKANLFVLIWGGEFYEDPILVHKNWLYDKATLSYINHKLLYPNVWAKRPWILFKQIKGIAQKLIHARKHFSLKRKTIQRIDYLLIYPHVDTEVQLIKKLYGLKTLQALPFLYNQNFDAAYKLLGISKDKSKAIVVQIGNSATPTNNHLDLFKVLSKFAGEEIEITLPLAYGDQNYRDVVKMKAVKTFGHKVIPIEDFVEREKYIKDLNAVDICIMYHNRQQALGNCIALLTLGKKLFLKSKNPLYHLFKEIGVIVFDADKINQLSFKQFTNPLSIDQIENNFQRMESYFSESVRLQYLRKLIE